MGKNTGNSGDFRPDPQGAGAFSRLYVTPTQRLRALKWALFSLVALLGLVLQDVIFSRMRIFGATTNLAPGVLIMVCILRGPESGGVFALVASLVYYSSGSAPGPEVILLLTAIGILAAAVREAFLRKGFNSTILCTGLGLVLYELLLFLLGLFLGRTALGYLPVYLLTGLLSTLAMAAFYPLLKAIDKIGGEAWKE